MVHCMLRTSMMAPTTAVYKTRHSQYDAAAASSLQCTRRRNDVTRCSGYRRALVWLVMCKYDVIHKTGSEQ